ncbi:hypothetical protein AAG747_25175 [Rapidithrix thailandica]|uniref:Uncharacterized protein n=1 Tax=Rapidithrix thailandica TaxID=413964 RepID=A0AAW9SF96_9BACT
MKQHKYIDLNTGGIEQYAMVVPLSDLDEWKKDGWLEYNQIGLPEDTKEAWMLYGDISEEETLIFNKPEFLSEIGKTSLLGRKITSINPHLGTYGMGGAGFFGFLLDNHHYLVYTAWGAQNYIRLNDQVISNAKGLIEKELLTSSIKNTTLKDIDYQEDSCVFSLEKNQQRIKIKLVKESHLLNYTTGKNRQAFIDGSISDYLLLQHKNATLIV